MPNTYTLDLSKIVFPKGMEEKVKQDRLSRVAQLVQGGMKKEEAEKLYPEEAWDPVQEIKDSIEGAVSNYFSFKFWNAERKSVIAPGPKRRQSGRVLRKIADEGAIVEITTEEMDFLVEVFGSELPPVSVYAFIADYLDEVKSKAV